MTWAEQRFDEIWRAALYRHTCQALFALHSCRLYGAVSYLGEIRDLGDAQILWEAIVEADKMVSTLQAGGIPCQVGLSALRHRAIVQALRR